MIPVAKTPFKESFSGGCFRQNILIFDHRVISFLPFSQKLTYFKIKGSYWHIFGSTLHFTFVEEKSCLPRTDHHCKFIIPYV